MFEEVSCAVFVSEPFHSLCSDRASRGKNALGLVMQTLLFFSVQYRQARVLWQRLEGANFGWSSGVEGPNLATLRECVLVILPFFCHPDRRKSSLPGIQHLLPAALDLLRPANLVLAFADTAVSCGVSVCGRGLNTAATRYLAMMPRFVRAGECFHQLDPNDVQ